MDKFSLNSARGVLFERNDVEENNRRDFPVTLTIKKVHQQCLVHTLDPPIPREIVEMPFGIVFITR